MLVDFTKFFNQYLEQNLWISGADIIPDDSKTIPLLPSEWTDYMTPSGDSEF